MDTKWIALVGSLLLSWINSVNAEEVDILKIKDVCVGISADTYTLITCTNESDLPKESYQEGK